MRGEGMIEYPCEKKENYILQAVGLLQQWNCIACSMQKVPIAPLPLPSFNLAIQHLWSGQASVVTRGVECL